jgi:hypothetical protein
VFILDTDFTVFDTPDSKAFRKVKLLAVDADWSSSDLQNWRKRHAGFGNHHKGLG